MRLSLALVSICFSTVAFAQTTNDTIKQKKIEGITLTVKKPTVETKVDRTVFNVANSSVLAGNTTWDVLRMTPLVSIDNNDVVKSEGESVTVYINDRKSVFTGKELKEYLKSIPAENLMKIEVITNPSAKYETTGQVINIVLKKREDEGIKGSVTLTNTKNTKNNQYSNLNVNYHKKSFTQSVTGSYSDNTNIAKSEITNTFYGNNDITKINTNSIYGRKSPSFTSSSEYELNDKNNVGVIFEYFQSKSNSSTQADGDVFVDGKLPTIYTQNQEQYGTNKSLGSNLFYKYYDKVKNKILDINTGINYNSNNSTNDFVKTSNVAPLITGSRIFDDSQMRNYYFKIDYSQPIDTLGTSIEVGAKLDFNNNIVPNNYFNLANNSWIADFSRTNTFHYSDNLNSVYANYSAKFFKKLETRIGLRYEYITFKLRQDVGSIEKKNSYGTLLPNVLLKYTFSPNYNLSASYNFNKWRPYFTEFNPFLMPNSDSNFYRGNMNLEPNPYHRFSLKLGVYKKYFLSLTYGLTDQDYWNTYVREGNSLIVMPDNFKGKSERYNLNFNTNQTFFKNKLSVNFNIGLNYLDNSDFNTKNNLNAKNYITNIGGSTNLSYTNLFNKNINITGWFGVYTQNGGNMQGNNTNFYQNIGITKIFTELGMEASLQLNNIFAKPVFDQTTFSQIGTMRSHYVSDWHGFSLTFIKRFGNQKVKENTKTDVEKNQGGAK